MKVLGGTMRVSGLSLVPILVLSLACSDPGASGKFGTDGGESGTAGAAEPPGNSAGGTAHGGSGPADAEYVGLFASSEPEGLVAGGGEGAGGNGEQLPLGPPYGTSTSCGDAIVGADEECDDGAGGAADACTSDCQTRDEPAVPAPGNQVGDRYQGAGRHPLSGLEDGFVSSYVEIDAETGEAKVGATVFDIWGKPTHVVAVSDGGDPIDEANPVVAALPNGRYAVAWSDFDGDGSDLGVSFRSLSAEGELGVLRAANAESEFSQLNPDMIWTGSELVVAWEDYSVPLNGPDLRYRTFDADLNPTSADLVLAGSDGPEAAVALTAFAGGWAAAYREGTAAGAEHLVVKAGNSSFRVGPIYGGPLDDRPALVELDATHLLLVFSTGTDPAVTGTYNVPRLRYSIIDIEGSLTPSFASFDPLDDVVTREAQTAHASPATARGADGLYVAWRSEARPSDAAGDQIWLKYLRWQPAMDPQLEMREAELLMPRLCEGSIGDQRSPALARVLLPPSGALAMAWDDYAKRQGEGEPDVVVHYAPTHERNPALGEVFQEPWTNTNGASWSSHWSMEPLAGTTVATHERERGKLSASASASAVLLVNHHDALNVDITTDLQFALNGSLGGIVARRADVDPDSYLAARLGTNVSDQTFRVYAMIDNVRTDLATMPLPTAFPTHAQGLFFKLRFRAITVAGGIEVAAKYWSADVAEPATWQLHATVPESDPVAVRLAQRPGRFGLYVSNGIGGRSVSFDNFRAIFFEGGLSGDLDSVTTPLQPLRRGKALFRTCTAANPCAAREGCCFDDTECELGLTCAAAPNTTAPWSAFGSHAKTCAPSHCNNLTIDADEVWVDCGGADCAPCACASTALPGSAGYCQSGCPCGAGGVDCTNHNNCLANMVCGQELGYKYGFPDGTDACTPSHCKNRLVDGDEPDPARPDWGGSCGSPACGTTNGAYAHCSVFCKCQNGHGDCNYDDECVAGTTCFGDAGDRFGLASGVDVCLKPHCYNNAFNPEDGETSLDCGGECGCGGTCPPCP